MLCKLCFKNELRRGLFDFVIDCPEMASKAMPGQFVHVLCGGPAYLRRPISVCDTIDGRFLRFIFEVRGKGTAELSKAQPGQMLDILGPLGNGFGLDPDPRGEVIVIGGGIGVFPLLMLARALPVRPIVMLGFRDSRSAVMIPEFANISRDVFVASDDGSIGHNGFVTDMLKERIARGTKISGIYACGPVPMMRIVADAAKGNGIECQISMEERMGCGVGACVTCACAMTDGSRKRVCKDGPVFSGAEVDFDG